MDNVTDRLLTVEEVQRNFQKFGLDDYIVFVSMLVGCAAVGVYYALRGKEPGGDEATEYLMGGRNMQVFPVAMSLIASFISGISLLGLPTEMYLHGTEFMYIGFSFVSVGFLASWLVIPVFHDLRLSSTYEYLHMRFDNKARFFGSALFTISLVFWLPIVIYVPALAFNQVTGVNVHVVTPCVCLVCIFYTSIGGIKAVVWTDVIQTFIMLGAMFIVMVKGTYDVGGLNGFWKPNWESGRITFPSWSPNPLVRHSIFTIFFGGMIHHLQGAIINQNMIQRFLTLPTVNLARRALWIYVCGTVTFIAFCGYSGLLAYANYSDCDPLSTGLAKEKDQILPLYVMKVMMDYPGMPGLFVAGVFSAALSTLSTGLNSMAAVFLEDFVKPNLGRKLSDSATSKILRSVVIIFGIICVVLVFIVEKLGSVLQLSISVSGITQGASFGLFIGGMLLPQINAKGALYGSLLSMSISSVLVMGAQHAMSTGAVYYPSKPLSTEGCDYTFEPVNLAPNITVPPADTFPLYRISYLYYTAFGGVLTVVLSLIISYATGGNDYQNMDPRLFSPVIRRRLEKQKAAALVPEETELL